MPIIHVVHNITVATHALATGRIDLVHLVVGTPRVAYRAVSLNCKRVAMARQAIVGVVVAILWIRNSRPIDFLRECFAVQQMVAVRNPRVMTNPTIVGTPTTRADIREANRLLHRGRWNIRPGKQRKTNENYHRQKSFKHFNSSLLEHNKRMMAGVFTSPI